MTHEKTGPWDGTGPPPARFDPEAAKKTVDRARKPRRRQASKRKTEGVSRNG